MGLLKLYIILGFATSEYALCFYLQNTTYQFSEYPEIVPQGIKLISPTNTEILSTDYDFIVVGSGSAGSVIANRLSEIVEWKILLLEVGQPENSLTQYPLLAPLFQLTDYNWDYTMEPEPKICRAMNQRRCAWPRGKALGGTTVINYMIYTRGNPSDYNRWAALGNSGWAYKDVLPYYLKSENSRLRVSNPDYHNKNGYLNVEDPYESELTKTFLEAAKELGNKIVDYNSPEQLGFSRIQANIKRGRRHSVARAFLKPILRRKNLHVVTGARVLELLIDSPTKTAYGVKVVRKGQQMFIKAKKEVVISAGALNSPQLLMLSGIGPKKHLKELGIKVERDLPVGQILYDHICYTGLEFNTNVTIEKLQDLYDPIQLFRWYTVGAGPLSSLGGIEALGFIKTSVANKSQDYPDVEIILGGAGGMHTDYGVINRRTLKISDDFYYKMYLSLEGTPSFSIAAIILHPKSKGYMQLRSSNPYHPPLFYGNFLSEEQDIRTLIEGIRYSIKLVETEAFKKYNATLNQKPIVGCETLVFNSDEYWRCAIQFLTTTVHHQVSTCKMGPTNDQTAVVDHTLKVHGINRLRVADTSIIPIPLSAHTNAPSIMIGEKASDLIKKDWGVL